MRSHGDFLFAVNSFFRQAKPVDLLFFSFQLFENVLILPIDRKKGNRQRSIQPHCLKPWFFGNRIVFNNSEDHRARKHTSEWSTLALKPREELTQSPKQDTSSSTKRTCVFNAFSKLIGSLHDLLDMKKGIVKIKQRLCEGLINKVCSFNVIINYVLVIQWTWSSMFSSNLKYLD